MSNCTSDWTEMLTELVMAVMHVFAAMSSASIGEGGSSASAWEQPSFETLSQAWRSAA